MLLVIFTIGLISQSSASFFGELTGALSTVKSSVGTLLADVGHDLKETYDCTVDAVELMIYDKDQISKYYDKCTGTSTESYIVTTEKIDATKTINIYFTPFISVTPKNDVTNKLDASLGEKYTLESKNIDKKLDNVEKVLSNETYRVDNISNHLEHEFGDLAKTVNKELNIIEEDKLDLQKILLEIEKLQWEREMHIDKTKDEIRGVFDEILKKINNSTKDTNFKNEIKAIVGDVETNSSKTILEELEKWKEKEVELLKGIKADEEKKQSTTESNIPRTFKEVAAKISKGLLTTSSPITAIVSSTKPVTQASNSTAKVNSTEPVTQRPTETTAVTSPEPSTKVSTLNTTVTSKEAMTQHSNPTNTVSSSESTTLGPIATSTVTSKGSSTQPSTSNSKFTTNKPILTSSTTTTVISTIPPTQAASTAVITTTSSTKLSTQTSSIAPTITSPELTTHAPIISTTVTSREQTTQALSPTTRISTESVTQATSTTTSTTTVATSTETKTEATSYTTVTIPTEPTTQSSSPRTTVTTKKPTTEAPSTTTTETTTEPTTTTTKKRKRHKKPKKKHQPILTTEKAIIKVLPTPPPSDDYGGLMPKDTDSAAEEALNIFTKSMKTKAILDKFFNNLK